MWERRSEPRTKVLKEAKVHISDFVSVPCTVRDISPSGARLQFETPVSLPGELRLTIIAADLTIPAAPAWQRRLEAGIRFTGTATVGAVDSSPKRILPAA